VSLPVIVTVRAMQERAQAWRAGGESVGLVPTMGALHRGHLSLVKRAVAECDAVVVSIFVNPAQFGPGEDFARYPRDLEGDRRRLEKEGIRAIFAPPEDAMYPAGHTVRVDPGPLGTRLEGAVRPGHFVGVATVVAKLFHITAPHRAYFGQKDAQQVAVIRRLVRDLDFDLTLVVCPTVREDDGLALSSRNAFLKPAEREAATVLARALAGAQAAFAAGERDGRRLEALVRETVATASGVNLQYAACVDPDAFDPAPEVVHGTVLAVAATIGRTRLIDNTILGGPGRL
jgi:pantoate--beta-alanine ligase